MSYCKINIGGKDRGLKFNQGAIIIMSQSVNPNHYTATINYATVYGGLMGNCIVKQEEPDFTYEEVTEWVDAMSKEDLAIVDAALNQAEAYKKLIASIPDETSKKKVQKKQQTNALK